MDKTYLRARFFGSETIYALDHVKSLKAGPETLDVMKADIRTLPKESAARLEELLVLMNTVIDVSRGAADSLQKAVDLVPASDWAKRLKPMPSGYFLPKRDIMFDDGPDGQRLYDIKEGRFLTKDEARGAR